MDYKKAFLESLTKKELVDNYDRLTGSSLGEVLKAMKGGGINYEIDVATGRAKEEILKFDKFFNEFIWSRMNAAPEPIKTQEEADELRRNIITTTATTLGITIQEAKKRVTALFNSGILNGGNPNETETQKKIDAFLDIPSDKY